MTISFTAFLTLTRDQHTVELSRWITLPFFPMEGLRIGLHPSDTEWGHWIESVLWHAPTESLQVRMVGEQFEPPDMLENYVAAGWRLVPMGQHPGGSVEFANKLEAEYLLAQGPE